MNSLTPNATAYFASVPCEAIPVRKYLTKLGIYLASIDPFILIVISKPEGFELPSISIFTFNTPFH